MEPLVSVIIPVYNASSTIEETVQSVANQTYRNIELIVVNDGSTDNSLQVLNDLKKNLGFDFRVVTKKNSGVSSARNEGIRQSNGEYIVFLDADDTLEEDIISVAVRSIESGNNLYQWGMTIKENDKYTRTSIVNKHYTRNQMIANCIILQDEQIGLYFRAVWGKLLITSIIKEHNIRFREDMYIGEDAVFLLEYLKYIEKYILVKETGYNYFVCNDSATHRFKKDLLKQSLFQMKAVLDYLANEQLTEDSGINNAVQNLKWWLYTSIFDNSFRGVKSRIIPFWKMFEEAFFFYDKYIRENATNQSCYSQLKIEYQMFNSCTQNNKLRLIWKTLSYKVKKKQLV